MCSMVLMAALTAGSATPGWHHCGGYCGYHGGWGGGCPGCSGGYNAGGFGDGCGCWGGYNSWGYCNMPPPNPPVMGGFGMTGGTVVPGPGAGNEERGKPKTNNNGDKERMIPTRARLLLSLPANAQLFIDDQPVKAAAGVQICDTPALEPDKDYFYMVRIEMMRDGQPFSQTRRIIVRAGQVARADFKDLETVTLRTAQAK
jgi:uncharacterized protein (TIGR03000 family)